MDGHESAGSQSTPAAYVTLKIEQAGPPVVYCTLAVPGCRLIRGIVK